MSLPITHRVQYYKGLQRYLLYCSLLRHPFLVEFLLHSIIIGGMTKRLNVGQWAKPLHQELKGSQFNANNSVAILFPESFFTRLPNCCTNVSDVECLTIPFPGKLLDGWKVWSSYRRVCVVCHSVERRHANSLVPHDCVNCDSFHHSSYSCHGALLQVIDTQQQPSSVLWVSFFTT